MLTPNMARHYGIEPRPPRVSIVSECAADGSFSAPLSPEPSLSQARPLRLVGSAASSGGKTGPSSWTPSRNSQGTSGPDSALTSGAPSPPRTMHGGTTNFFARRSPPAACPTSPSCAAPPWTSPPRSRMRTSSYSPPQTGPAPSLSSKRSPRESPPSCPKAVEMWTSSGRDHGSMVSPGRPSVVRLGPGRDRLRCLAPRVPRKSGPASSPVPPPPWLRSCRSSTASAPSSHNPLSGGMACAVPDQFRGSVRGVGRRGIRTRRACRPP